MALLHPFKRGLFDAAVDRHRDGYPYFVEAIDTFRARMADSNRVPAPDQAESLLEWCDKAQESAEALKQLNDVTRFAAVAAELGKGEKSATAMENLTRVLNRAGKIHENAGRYKEAIDGYVLGVTAGRPVLDKNPWHWYLRSGVISAYRNLALAYQHEKDVPNELLAWREYMKTWLGPYHGMKIDEFIKPDAPMTEEEVVRVRAFVEKSPGMKRFTVPCDFSGTKYPFHIYVTNWAEPHDAVADQARWLRDVRGGTVPAEVLDSFKRLYKIAKENNVSFIDLCVYALGGADSTAPKKGSSNNLSSLPVGDVANALFSPDKNPTTDLQAQLRSVADLKEQIEGGPYNPELVVNLILANKKLGETYQAKGGHADAVATFAEAVRLVETHSVSDPVAHRRLQADLYLALGKALDGAKEYERAELILRRHLSLLAELGGPAPTAAHRARIDEGLVTLAVVIRQRGQLAEAARTCAPAVARGSRAGADLLVRIYDANPAVAVVLPADLRVTFENAIARSIREGKPAGECVAADMSGGRALPSPRAADDPLASLEESAARYHEVAVGHRTGARNAEYLAALVAEFEVLGALTAIEPRRHPKSAQQKVAAILAIAYLNNKETELAVKWADRSGPELPVSALLTLAEHVEKGVNIKADPKKAEHYCYLAYYRRGKQLFEDRKYDESLRDLSRLCQMSAADAEDFNLLGMCEGKLGHWEEAIKAYRRSHHLDPKESVLNLLEALIVSGRPKEACDFVAELEKMKWSPQAANSRRDLTILNGLHAIAEQLTAEAAIETAAERRLLELNSVPGLGARSWTWDEIDAWFAKADLPDRKKAAIRRILDELKGRSPERATAHFPLAVGTKWVYAQRRTDDAKAELPDVVIAVVAKDTINDVECYKLERSSGKQAPTSEHVVVRYNGVYRVAVDGKPLSIPYRLFALPGAAGATWVQVTDVDADDIKFRARKENEVEVPASKYKDALAVREETDDPAAKFVRQVWYADGTGPVKIEAPLPGKGNGLKVLELKSYEPGKGDKPRGGQT